MRGAVIRAARAGGLCIWLVASPALVRAQAPAPGGGLPPASSYAQTRAQSIDRLLSSARLWRARQRNDLARAALQKVLLTDSAQPQALAMLGEIEIEENHLDKARLDLQQLEASHPDALATRGLGALVHAYTMDRERLSRARLMVNAGQSAAAYALYRQMFPNGAPPGQLGIEYYRAQAGTPGGWPAARAGLERMARSTPDDPLPLQALAALMVERPADRLVGVRLAAALAARPDVSPQVILTIWRRGLSNADSNFAWLPLYRRYLALAPDDSDIRKQYEQLMAQQTAQRRLEADPAYQEQQRGIAQLDAGHLAQAETALLAAQRKRPDDPQLLGALGLLRMRQGHQHEAYDYFAKAASYPTDDQGKWRSLMRTASFWAALNDARRALDAGHVNQADTAARKALALQPDNASALAELGEIASADHRDGDAEGLYRQALQRDPQNDTALRGLIALLARHHRRQEVADLLSQWHARYPQMRGQLDRAQAAYLAERADQQVTLGHNGPALAMLERAVRMDPPAPWTRYALASLYRRLNLPDLGRQVMADGVELPPSKENDAGNQAQMRYAQAIYLNVTDDLPGALRTLDAIPPAQRSTSMRQLRRALRIRQIAQTARQAKAAGDARGSERLFRQAIAMAGQDPELLSDVATELIESGESERGLALLHDWLRAHADSPHPAERLRYAELLSQARRDDALHTWLAGFDPATLDAAQRDEWQALQDRLMLRAEARAQANNQFAAARAALQPLLARTPPDPRAQGALVDLYISERRYDDAARLSRSILKRDPQNRDVRLSLVRALYEMHEDDAATRMLARVLAEAPAADVSTRLGVVRRLTAMQQLGQAGAITEELHQRFPDDPSVTVQMGRIDQANGHYNEAMQWYRLARRQEVAAGALPGYDGLTTAQSAEAGLDDRRQSHVALGYETTTKSGSDGISRFNTQVVPLYGQYAIGYDGHVFAQTDHVSLNAGALPLNGSSEFGTLPLLGATAFQQRYPGVGTDFGARRMSAHGQALAIGYRNDWLRADIGTTPLGFPVSYLTGGVRLYGSRGRLDYWVELSRRPVSGSELSYAGTRLPLPAALGGDLVYGGVRRDALTFHVSRDLRYVGLSGEISAARLTGKNVLSNSEFSARGGLDVPLLYRPDMRVNSGLTLFFDSYAQNELFYTYGYGGYYSPQAYTSLTLPIEWEGRHKRLSYYLRASVSVSHSHEKAMPFFPTSDMLQSLGDNQFYGSGGGWGYGFSLALRAEYHVNRRWVIGAQAQAERSQYYAPNRVMVYMRYYLDPQRPPVSFPPSPVDPISSY